MFYIKYSESLKTCNNESDEDLHVNRFIKNDDALNVREKLSFFSTSHSTVYNEYHKLYWQFIEKWIVDTKAKKNIDDLRVKLNELDDNIHVLSDYYNLCNVIDVLNNYQFSNKAFINFIRHFPALNCYVDHNNYKITAKMNSIRFHIWRDDINLIMDFNDDYLVNFYSYDNDVEDVNSKLVYSLKGNFSSSSNLKKSYKIERLLSILLNGNSHIREFSYDVDHIRPLTDKIENYRRSEKIKFIRSGSRREIG
ncbi:hypothetical protein [Acinetobacter seifertii]|uniref:Uncharacterized protein n=1 Tax=Acinetobacter seifertii TaxID=1530123 RepID=A0A7H2V918_9GAMM|nr:hypothetical protein [Acinetobacter seifertii]QNX72851.1 hypothetical protein IC776_02820 [Acinetobacter seifertii]